MALVLPPSGVEEDIMAGVTCAPPLPSMVATILEKAITGITGSKIVKTGSQIDPTLDSGGAS
jgi:hypothetical protein